MNANFVESNPIPVKAVLTMMGLIEENLRLPMMPLLPAHRAPLQKLAEELGLLQVGCCSSAIGNSSEKMRTCESGR